MVALKASGLDEITEGMNVDRKRGLGHETITILDHFCQKFLFLFFFNNPSYNMRTLRE